MLAKMTLIIYNKQQKGYTEYYRKGEVVQKIYFTAHDLKPSVLKYINCIAIPRIKYTPCILSLFFLRIIIKFLFLRKQNLKRKSVWPIKIYHISCRKSAHSEFLYAFSYTVLQSPVCVDDFCRHYASPEKKE